MHACITHTYAYGTHIRTVLLNDGVMLFVLQATELQSKLQAAVQTAEEINTQEKMFGWGCTK
jgi:hypothetical protein